MPKLLTDQSELVALDSLRVHPRNVNNGAFDAIEQSIVENGFFGGLVVQQSSRYILVGNHRFQAARKAGLSKLPVFWVDVTDDRALRILLADNRTGRLGADDPTKLAELLAELVPSSESLAGTGYSAQDLDTLISSITPPDFTPASIEDQGKLDERSKCKCPECGHEFVPD